MLKRLSTVLLSAGLLLGLTPAMAAASELQHHNGDDHYRCWYHCSDRYEYRYRRYQPRFCWYHDRYGWYRARCGDYQHDHYYGNGPSWRDRDSDSAHAGGGYDSHREHDRN